MSTILIVEDEPFILMDLEYAVEDAGHVSVGARSVPAALAIIRDRTIDAAILDHNLGQIETCCSIVEQLAALRIPAIIHTAEASRLGSAIMSLEPTVVSKPAPAGEVVAAVLDRIR